jgi:hypothetical protein
MKTNCLCHFVTPSLLSSAAFPQRPVRVLASPPRPS